MKPRNDVVLGTLLRKWRERALLTQEQLAERAGLSVRTIRRLEGGVPRRPRTASVRLLAEALSLNGAEQTALASAARGAPPAGPSRGHVRDQEPGRLRRHGPDPLAVHAAHRLAAHALGQLDQTRHHLRQTLHILSGLGTAAAEDDD